MADNDIPIGTRVKSKYSGEGVVIGYSDSHNARWNSVKFDSGLVNGYQTAGLEILSPPPPPVDEHREASNRSFNYVDLVKLTNIWGEYRALMNKHPIDSFRAIIRSEYDYIIGELWWDAEVEDVRFDPARYGES
jgi:hypothetical protein